MLRVWANHSHFLRLMHEDTTFHHFSFEPEVFCQTCSEEFCEITARSPQDLHCTVKAPAIRLAPDPSVVLRRPQRMLSDYVNAHTRSPVSSLRSCHAAYSSKPLPDGRGEAFQNASRSDLASFHPLGSASLQYGLIWWHVLCLNPSV